MYYIRVSRLIQNLKIPFNLLILVTFGLAN